MNSQPTLGFLLHEVARLLRKRFEQRAGNLGLTRSQWQALAFLSKNEGIHQAGLAEILEIKPITLARILDKLAERELIERRPHPTDRRIWLLYMRDEAQPLLNEMRKIGEATRSEALEGISDAERDHLIEVLTHMKKNILQTCRTPAGDGKKDHG